MSGEVISVLSLEGDVINQSVLSNISYKKKIQIQKNTSNFYRIYPDILIVV